MAETKKRMYRQSDDLYDLIGLLATQLKTNRTTVVEMGVLALRDQVVRSRQRLVEQAREIDDEHRQITLDAMMKGRGMVRQKEDLETVGS